MLLGADEWWSGNELSVVAIRETNTKIYLERNLKINFYSLSFRSCRSFFGY